MRPTNLILLLLVGCTPGQPAPRLVTDPQAAELRTDLVESQTDLHEACLTLSDTQAQLAENKVELARAQVEIDRLTDELATCDSRWESKVNTAHAALAKVVSRQRTAADLAEDYKLRLGNVETEAAETLKERDEEIKTLHEQVDALTIRPGR